MSRAAVSQASTSSTCATGRRGAAGIASRLRRRFRRTSSQARANATSRPTSGSPGSRSKHGSIAPARRAWRPVSEREGSRSDSTQGGDTRSAGRGRRARSAGARLRRRCQRARRQTGRARRRGSDTARADVREAARQPVGRGLRGPAARRQQLSEVKFGILQFPGSCDEVDALDAARRVGDAELIWHAERDLKGCDAIVVPGGFSYGDYLRAGAIARFSRVMESVIAFASEGGLVLGICNGFQVLCEARLLPGALLGNVNRRFTFRQLALEVVSSKTPFTCACALGERLSIPAKHSWGRYYADERTLSDMDAAGQIVLAYAVGENFNGSLRDIAGVRNEAGNVFGLMPHPEHAVSELLGGSTGGLKIFQSMRMAVEGVHA